MQDAIYEPNQEYDCETYRSITLRSSCKFCAGYWIQKSRKFIFESTHLVCGGKRRRVMMSEVIGIFLPRNAHRTVRRCHLVTRKWIQRQALQNGIRAMTLSPVSRPRRIPRLNGPDEDLECLSKTEYSNDLHLPPRPCCSRRHHILLNQLLQELLHRRQCVQGCFCWIINVWE